ncbi:hypothetical protein BH11MYX1_BH11MYX1_21420 [soil metagenome]
MFVAVERLMIKLRQPADRARELIALHARLRAELAATPSIEEGADEVELARAVLEQKRAVSARLTAVQSCQTCATGQPRPVGHYNGGACCAGVTADLFDENELAALAHAGTRVGNLVAPRPEHAGCSFRGATGCTIELDHRPARCVHYICNTLRRELHRHQQLDAIEGELAELDRRMQAFRTVHQARLDRDVLAPLIEALAASTEARPRGARGASIR